MAMAAAFALQLRREHETGAGRVDASDKQRPLDRQLRLVQKRQLCQGTRIA